VSMTTCTCPGGADGWASDFNPDCPDHGTPEPTDAEIGALLPVARAASRWAVGARHHLKAPGDEGRNDGTLINIITAVLRELRTPADVKALQEDAAGDQTCDRLWVFPMDAKVDVILPDGTHRYWSTHCRHAPPPSKRRSSSQRRDQPDGHDACAATELALGVPRQPSRCKTCAAPCGCWCHQEGTR
jgi:hypothetical protein